MLAAIPSGNRRSDYLLPQKKRPALRAAVFLGEEGNLSLHDLQLRERGCDDRRDPEKGNGQLRDFWKGFDERGLQIGQQKDNLPALGSLSFEMLRADRSMALSDDGNEDGEPR